MFITIENSKPIASHKMRLWDVHVNADDTYSLYDEFYTFSRHYSFRDSTIDIKRVQNEPNNGQLTSEDAWTAYVLASLALKSDEHREISNVTYVEDSLVLEFPEMNSKVIASPPGDAGRDLRVSVLMDAAYALFTAEEAFPEEFLLKSLKNQYG